MLPIVDDFVQRLNLTDGWLEKLCHQHRLPSGRGDRPLQRALGCGTGFPYLKGHIGDASDIPFHRETHRIARLYMLVQTLQGVGEGYTNDES